MAIPPNPPVAMYGQYVASSGKSLSEFYQWPSVDHWWKTPGHRWKLTILVITWYVAHSNAKKRKKITCNFAVNFAITYSGKTNKQTNKQIKSRFSWCRRTGARKAVLLFTRRCWQPLRNLFPHTLHYGTMFATNWSSNGGLAAEASVTCRRSQWSNSSHFSLLFSPPKRNQKCQTPAILKRWMPD